jgi:hypothetical protein
VATESLSRKQSRPSCCFFSWRECSPDFFFSSSSKVVAFNESEENTRVHDKIVAIRYVTPEVRIMVK